MPDDEPLQEYIDSMRDLQQRWLDSGVTESEFLELHAESLQDLRNDTQTTRRRNVKWRCFYLLFIVFIIVVYNFRSIHSNVQEYIYPGLKLLRRMSIPFISLFPSLTEFYHDTCLLHNPFFTVVDMECWPCSSINNIQEVDQPIQDSHQHTAPFIYKTKQKVITLKDLQEFYSKNSETLKRETPKILVNKKYYSTTEELFTNEISDDNSKLLLWKFNTMNSGRALRQLISRPTIVPKYGQSTERFLIIDSSQGEFSIPDTECNFSFILVVAGSRVVELQPATECKHQCKSLRVELKETYLLWYNWWYWKPKVKPNNGNETFIANIGSYC